MLAATIQKPMARPLSIALLALASTTLASCSLLFEVADNQAEEDIVLTRELVSTIGIESDFATLAEWLSLRDGTLPQRQVMRVRSLGQRPGGEHVLAGANCAGLLRPVRADTALTQLLILDLEPGSAECAAGEILVGTGNVQLEVIEALPKGTSEILRFETSPVLGPLTVDDEIVASEEYRLTLEAGIPHRGLSDVGIVIENPPGTDAHGLRIGTDYTIVRGFEIRSWITTETVDPYSAVRIAANYVEIDRLLVHDEASALQVKSDGITTNSNVTGAIVRNSFLYDLGRAGIDDGWSQSEQNPTPMVVSNCTLRRCTMFVDAGGRYGCVSFERDKSTVFNTIALLEGGVGSAFLGNFSSDSDYNAGDEPQTPGALRSYNASPEDFVGLTDLHLAPGSGPLFGCGIEGSPLELDIDGEERPSSAWSIGADQSQGLGDCDE